MDCSDFKYCTGISLCKSDRENLCFIYKISKITLFVSLTIAKGSKIASLFAFFDHCQGVILMREGSNARKISTNQRSLNCPKRTIF